MSLLSGQMEAGVSKNHTTGEQLDSEVVHDFCSRLSGDTTLVLPSSLYKDNSKGPSPDQVVEYLEKLTLSDPASFLER